jgi:Peptidase family C25
VLLGGDVQYVPDRKCYLTVEVNTDVIPADLYYADLQYSWNSDGNSHYGEMTDSVDLYHDVYVGRAG